MIIKCLGSPCLSPYQDAKYGLGNRVANPTKDVEKVRCTVCGSLTNPKSRGLIWTDPKKKVSEKT